MDNSTLLIISITVLFPFLFCGMWCAVSLLLATAGGWRRLAKSFPSRSQSSGKRFFMESGKVGPIAYKSCLIIHSASGGLYLSVLLPFRYGHPPLFIPWHTIRNVVTRRFWGTEHVVFDVGSPGVATLQLPKKVFEGHPVAGL